MPASPELSSFIRDHFRSVWTLELLLYLKDNSSAAWRSEALVQALRASDAIVSKGLEVLLTGGIIVLDEEGRAQYAPATEELRKLVGDTQELYSRKPDAVRRLIVSSSSGLSAFADSFRLRRD